MQPMNSAIPPDELLDRPVRELSATELLAALSHPAVAPDVAALLPDKKKYELWIDETGLPDYKLRDLLERLRGEKKKVELEKPPRFEGQKMPVENVIDPRQVLIDPAVIEQIADRVAARLRQ